MIDTPFSFLQALNLQARLGMKTHTHKKKSNNNLLCFMFSTVSLNVLVPRKHLAAWLQNFLKRLSGK